jgi:hypothetical protein
MFKKSNYFVNTARVDPNVLAVDGFNQLKIAGTNTNAICIMLGVVTECFLVDDAKVISQPYPARKITIVPFAQEMQRDTSLWGQLFNFHVITTSVSGQGMSFLTKRQGLGGGISANTNPGSAPSTPKKRNNLFKTVTSPLVSQVAEGSRAVAYQYARSFDEEGTIYFLLSYLG